MTDVSAAPATAVNPGKGTAVAAIIFAFLIPLLGLILGIVAAVKSKNAGFKNGLAVAAIVISVLFPIVAGGIIVAATAGGVAAQCAEYGPGEHILDNGVTLTCG